MIDHLYIPMLWVYYKCLILSVWGSTLDAERVTAYMKKIALFELANLLYPPGHCYAVQNLASEQFATLPESTHRQTTNGRNLPRGTLSAIQFRWRMVYRRLEYDRYYFVLTRAKRCYYQYIPGIATYSHILAGCNQVHALWFESKLYLGNFNVLKARL